MNFRKSNLVEAIYDYFSATGEYLYSHIVFKSGVSIRLTIDSDGEVISDYDALIKEIRRGGEIVNNDVLYRLPELIQAIREGQTIHMAPDEKTVDALIEKGNTATTTGGAVWHDGYTRYFHGVDVVLLFDDEDIAALLKSVCNSFQIKI